MRFTKAKCSVYIATSLDGFIAKSDGDIDWLHHPDYTVEGEDFGYNTFMDSISALIMGRNTYDKVLTYGEWPYSKPVFVLTSKTLDIPENMAEKVFFLKGTPQEVIRKTIQQGFDRLYVDGGKTIQSFLRVGLISEITITQLPVLLGKGIPLFCPLQTSVPLTLISSTTYPNGFAKTTYRVQNNE